MVLEKIAKQSAALVLVLLTQSASTTTYTIGDQTAACTGPHGAGAVDGRWHGTVAAERNPLTAAVVARLGLPS